MLIGKHFQPVRPDNDRGLLAGFAKAAVHLAGVRDVKVGDSGQRDVVDGHGIDCVGTGTQERRCEDVFSSGPGS